MREATLENLPKFVDDAAVWILRKLVDEIMNGVSGTSYPKAYPGAIVEGQKGYLGVVTSNLRRSIGVEKTDEFIRTIKQTIPSLAPYHNEMAAWSKRKYGLTFYQITRQLYGPKVTKEFFQLLSKQLKDVRNLNKPIYKNPFP